MVSLLIQVNARKIYDEPNALAGILDNKLFVAILAGEAVLQVSLPCMRRMHSLDCLTCSSTVAGAQSYCSLAAFQCLRSAGSPSS